jgi:hypothetical protein
MFVEYTVNNNPIKVIKTIKLDTNKSNLKDQSIRRLSTFINVNKNNGRSVFKFKILIKIYIPKLKFRVHRK